MTGYINDPETACFRRPPVFSGQERSIRDLNPATSVKPSIDYDHSAVATYNGTKYVQPYSGFTPSYVKQNPNDHTRGVRMEDDGCVIRVGKRSVIAVIADGHGSIPTIWEGNRAQSRDGKSTREYTCSIGGRECAHLASKTVSDTLSNEFLLRPGLEHASTKEIGALLNRVFDEAQRTIETHALAGSKPVKVELYSEGGGDPYKVLSLINAPIDPEASIDILPGDPDDKKKTSENWVANRDSSDKDRDLARVRALTYNSIDGQSHFSKLYRHPSMIDDCETDTRIVVIDKVKAPYALRGGSLGEVVVYHPPMGLTKTHQYRLMAAEYGTTLTAVLCLPAEQVEVVDSNGAIDNPGSGGSGPGRVVVAAAGDSDVFLFQRTASTHPGNTGGYYYHPQRLTSDHSVRSESEVNRVISCGGMTIAADSPHRFRLVKGDFADLQYEIAPSRALGHMVLRHHGIVHQPGISRSDMLPGDVIVVASDGLWTHLDEYADEDTAAPELLPRLAGATPEYRSAVRIAAFLDSIAQRGSGSPDPSAEGVQSIIPSEVSHGLIQMVINTKSARAIDNVSVAVISVIDTTPLRSVLLARTTKPR